jgi:hypothetical protein
VFPSVHGKARIRDYFIARLPSKYGILAPPGLVNPKAQVRTRLFVLDKRVRTCAFGFVTRSLPRNVNAFTERLKNPLWGQRSSAKAELPDS